MCPSIDRSVHHRHHAQDFARGTTWPIGQAAMAALLDLGVTEERMARYFRVPRPAVGVLRRLYGLDKTRA